MKPLIKSSAVAGSADIVRPFAARQSIEFEEKTSPEDLLGQRIAALEIELARRDEELPALIEEARAQGAADALGERSGLEEKALDALQQLLGDVRRDWSKRLESWDAAAAGIAREALEQVFCATGDLSGLVEAAIGKRLERLESQCVVRIRVSPIDFAGDRLEGSASRIGMDLVADSGLERGACEIDLKLGHADVGLGTQWDRIRRLLDRIEGEGVPE